MPKLQWKDENNTYGFYSSSIWYTVAKLKKRGGQSRFQVIIFGAPKKIGEAQGAQDEVWVLDKYQNPIQKTISGLEDARAFVEDHFKPKAAPLSGMMRRTK